jgi:hypothetical protein
MKNKEMKNKEMQDFFSGKNEIELTNELIEQLVKDKKWGDVKSLKELRDMGAKWNTKRNSVVFPSEFI